MTSIMLKARLIALVVPFVVLGACGGQSFTEGDDDDAGGDGGTSAAGKSSSGSGGRATAGRGSSGDGSGGTGTAGSGAAGNGSGGTGTAGSAPTGGTATTGGTGQGTGGSGCCLAFPTCGPGEQEVAGPEACLPGSVCHEVSICCATIWCTSETPQCDAYPSCDAGDTRLDGPCPPVAAEGGDSDAATAPLPGSCYSRSLCGSTVWCLDTSCDPSTEYNRKYFQENGCGLPDPEACTTNTTYFTNACGCGCEQDPSCPDMFSCVNPANPNDAARPAGGSSGLGAPIPQAGMGNTGNIGAELPVCTPEDLARCPYTKTY